MEKAWDFFSSPENLKEITPDYMGFKIQTEIPPKMYPGMIIAYKVKPLPGFQVNWVTEITQIKEYEYFIDCQLSGPYKIWHHEHHFKRVEGGVEMTDLLYYMIPYGIFGRLLNFLFIRKKVEGIFSYRNSVLQRIFGTVK
jgi:ligand-binding SRPBCC domain-containing protein